MENFNRIENTIILFAQAAEYTVAGLDKEDVITEENGGDAGLPAVSLWSGTECGSILY